MTAPASPEGTCSRCGGSGTFEVTDLGGRVTRWVCSCQKVTSVWSPEGTPDLRDAIEAALEACQCIHGVSDYDIAGIGCPECEADAVLAVLRPTLDRADEAERALGRIEAAAGMGPLAAVAMHQRRAGVEGDHEQRLREKRVAEIVATVTEETEWRRQVVAEVEIERDEARAALARVQALCAEWGRLYNNAQSDQMSRDLRAALDGEQ